MDDTISRQEAIKAIEAYFGDLPIKGHYDMLQLIKQLPSAQPKIRCKDCKCYESNGWCEGFEACVSSDDYCSFAKRRTDE